MVLKQALVILSQQDYDAPDLPGIATVGKGETWDDGGWALGAAAATRGALWVERPYFNGNPTVDWMVEKADAVTAAGGYCQIGNEQNLPLELWAGGIEAWRSFDADVRARVQQPERLLAMPPSPGVAGWEQWVTPDGPHSAHAYGSLETMRGIVQWFLDNTGGDVYVTECNWGAGNVVDVDDWSANHLRPFLDWCAGQARVKMVAYFCWIWHGGPELEPPVDAADTSVVDVLTTWVPPMNGGANGDVVLSVPTVVQYAAPANFEPGPRATTRGVVIHTTRGGSGSLEDDYRSTVAWFQNPTSGVSAHLVVGPAEVARCLHDSAIGWHCKTANSAFLGLEIAQPTMSTPLSDFQYQAAAEACRLWAAAYGFPLARSWSETVPGLVGHEDTESGRADGKTDPGTLPAGVFDWDRFLALCRGAPAFDVDAARDQLWTIATACEQGGWPWLGQGVKSAVALSKGER